MPTMVVIRLSKSGATHRPFYHVVVTDSRQRRDSNYIERLGYLNHFANGNEKPYELNMPRIDHWVKNGAIMRPSIAKLVKQLKREENMTPEEIAKLKEKKIKRAKARALAAKPVIEEVTEEVTAKAPAEEKPEVPVEEVTEETPEASTTKADDKATEEVVSEEKESASAEEKPAESSPTTSS